ncbi:MAG TPA: DUF503 domain-containing protein [Dehalococcoidia bacterium]|nr:DUF503 domain-containing protein [Dehalococcoidia bacterium]
MHIGVCRLTLHLPQAQSLKDKRQVARSLTARIRNQFNVAVAEAADNDLWQRLTLAACCVTNDAAHADQIMAAVASFVAETRPDLELLDFQTEIISGA